ncbi:MAG: hypothetical protein WC011_04345 [Candidatus Paceibacterota bacterium]
MKNLIFFFSLFYFSFTAKAELPDSISYYEDKEHYLVKKTILKKDSLASVFDFKDEKDSVKTIEIYHTYIMTQRLSKLPIELWDLWDKSLSDLVTGKKEESYISKVPFVFGVFSLSKSNFVYEENSFKKYTKKESKSIILVGFGFMLIVFFYLIHQIQEIILKKYNFWLGATFAILGTAFFLTVFCFIYFRNFYKAGILASQFNLPNILLVIIVYILFKKYKNYIKPNFEKFDR